VIGTIHQLAVTRPRQDGANAAAPTIEIRLAGDDGNDLLFAALFASDLDEDLIQALIDGGQGIDVCVGNVKAIDCEL
jgi:hypothetical protein